MAKHVVMFSSGAGSWAAARRVADQHGTEDLHLVFSDVKGDNPSPHAGEDQDNYRFLRQAAWDIGAPLVWLNEGRDVWKVFEDNRFLGNTRLANCSKFLKQQPARAWLEENCDPADTTVYVGIDWSESHRLPAIERGYAPYKALAPLCDPPYLDKDDILEDLRQRGIKPPRLYEMGFAHANCGGFCVRSGQAQFKRLLEKMPERYAYHEQKEQNLRTFLGKDIAILRNRKGGTTKPLTLREFREQLQADQINVDPYDIGGCGCFVEEENAA
ncbi:hypothetical protein [Streptomyces sp. NPDC004528]|uniref:hypothetical protein n=1 Tax=Streptomyces sp. NPDC004528 TaxID=3154550 RepID=UPI0033B9F1C9